MSNAGLLSDEDIQEAVGDKRLVFASHRAIAQAQLAHTLKELAAVLKRQYGRIPMMQTINLMEQGVMPELFVYRPITHCLRGHLYDEANTYQVPNGHRDCRSCKREAQRTRRAAKRNGIMPGENDG